MGEIQEWKNAEEAKKIVNYAIDPYNRRMAPKFLDRLTQNKLGMR